METKGKNHDESSHLNSIDTLNPNEMVADYLSSREADVEFCQELDIHTSSKKSIHVVFDLSDIVSEKKKKKKKFKIIKLFWIWNQMYIKRVGG